MILGLWLCALALRPAGAMAQSPEYRLNEEGEWTEERAPEPGSDEAVIAEAQMLLAEEEPGAARDILDEWLDKNESGDSRWLATAYLLRGEAKLADDEEYASLFDFETLIRRFPQSEEFAIAIEHELDIADRYARGLKRRFLGMRVMDAGDEAVEILIRVQERMPGSTLAENAGDLLADYYFRKRDWELAAEAYDLYIVNYPNGANVMKAMERRIIANIARYNGPEYDASTVLDAEEQARIFMRIFPAEAERVGFGSELLARLEETQAEQMLLTAEWQLKVDDAPGARFTLRRLLQKHPSTRAAQRAMAMMDERGWEIPSAAQPATEGAATEEPATP